MAHPTGESKSGALRLDFDRRLKLEFHGSNVTSDAGLLPFRELDDILGLTALAGVVLSDDRRGKNTRHVLSGLLRQSVFGWLAGDLERCALRPGNVHSAHGWKDEVEPVVARYRGKFKRRYFRADAAFANPEVYEFLEAEGFKYAIRLPANQILQERIGYLLKRPVGRIPI
jgi:hypothetical protein